MNVVTPPEAQDLNPAADPRMGKCEIAAFVVMAAAFVFVMYNHLLAALLAGLFVYAMVHRIAARLVSYRGEHKNSKLYAMLILSLAVVGVSAGITFAIIGLVRGRVGDVQQMLDQIVNVVEHSREWFTARGIGAWIPDAERMHEILSDELKKFIEHIKSLGPGTMKMALHALVGIVIGALLSFANMTARGPLSEAFFERVRKFANSFEAVIFAQVKISALNTVFTSIYLLIVLPLFGVQLPFRATLVAVTFVCGLLPVLGNLVSNGIIALISLGVSPYVAAASLGYLIIIHKLEYFLNAKIVGGHIDASAWEILLAMLCMEAAFGIPGVILAPIAYAYLKAELKGKKLI